MLDFNRPTRIEKESLLLVEGPDDVHFFRALLEQRGRQNIQIDAVGGKDQIPAVLRLLRKRTGFSNLRWLGVVQDADSDAQERSAARSFQKVRTALLDAGLPAPVESWTESGAPEGLRVVVFILPHEENQGYLETWLLTTRLQSTKIKCAREFVECLGTEAPRKKDKAILAAYFAGMDPEKLRIGDAIQVPGTISLDSDVFHSFIDRVPL